MRKVILIDDNKAFAKMMAVSLPWEEMGLELCSVQYQGDDALEAIRKDKPDLVITDINMPGTDGFEVMRRTQQELPHTQFILITAYDDFQYAYQAFKLKPFDFILKPISREDMCRAILQAMEKKDQLDREREQLEEAYPARVMDVIRYIRKHLREAITLETMAEEMHTSISSLSRAIKRETGMRYGELLTQLRIEEAKRLLKDPDIRIGDIAELVGYKNYATLHNVFTRVEGVPPTRYRKGGRGRYEDSQ